MTIKVNPEDSKPKNMIIRRGDRFASLSTKKANEAPTSDTPARIVANENKKMVLPQSR
jgi:hypothetical protein